MTYKTILPLRSFYVEQKETLEGVISPVSYTKIMQNTPQIFERLLDSVPQQQREEGEEYGQGETRNYPVVIAGKDSAVQFHISPLKDRTHMHRRVVLPVG
jgi:hypothetical protein